MNNIIHEWITKKSILQLIMKYPDREFTVNELSRLSGISYATSWRFIQKLNATGIISTKVFGHSVICKLNKSSPFLKEIEKIIDIEPSPHQMAVKKFAAKAKKISGVKKIILFGSVGRKKERAESDIDVALIADKKSKMSQKKIIAAANQILEKFKLKIIPIIMTEKEFGQDKQFQREVMKGRILYERNKGS